MRIRKTAPKEFTVDRSKWVHGEGNEPILGESCLLNEEGNMCCLGFYAKKCGATNRAIKGHAFPHIEVPLMGEERGTGVISQSHFCEEAAGTNDDGSLTKKEREKKIKAHFKNKDVKVKFVGRYPKGVRK